MGRWDLSGDNTHPGKCACTGVRQDTSESDTISKSREGHFRKAVWQSTENMTLPEKWPFLTLLCSSRLLPQSNWVFRSQSWKVKIGSLMLKINTPPSYAPNIHIHTHTHTHTKTPSCGTASLLLHTVSGGTQNSQLLQRDQQVSSYTFFQCLIDLWRSNSVGYPFFSLNIYFFRLFSTRGYYKILNIVSCTIQ